MRSPHLHDTLRRFCLGAFAVFVGELDTGADLPFAFEEHGSHGRPTLYEYRPLVRGFVEARADRLYERDDVRRAVADLQREPAARIFARAHDGVTPDEARALYRSVLVPLLVARAEGCGGFDWDDHAFDRAYAELEESLFGDGHAYGAVAPLVGISCGTQIELGGGIRVRAAAPGELAAMWPEASGLLPRDFGREPDRLCVLELERVARARRREGPTRRASSPTPSPRSGSRPPRPSPPGPVLFERLDWRPYGIRPVLPIAATAPPGEPTRLDPFRASVAAELRAALALADDDAPARRRARPLGARRSSRTIRSAPSSCGTRSTPRSATARACGPRACAPPRCSARRAEERADLVERFREPTLDLVRRLLVAVLLHGNRGELLRELDGALLGAARAGRERVAELRAS